MKLCMSCGEKAMSLTNIKGQKFSFKDFEKVEISVECNVNQCSKCGELALRPSDVKLMNDAFEYSISSQLRKNISKLSSESDLSQKDLAKNIGITEQYLSNLKKGIKFPSASIFYLIKVLANSSEAQAILGIPVRVHTQEPIVASTYAIKVQLFETVTLNKSTSISKVYFSKKSESKIPHIVKNDSFFLGSLIYSEDDEEYEEMPLAM